MLPCFLADDVLQGFLCCSFGFFQPLQSTIAALREQNLNNELISFCRTDRIEVECMKKLAWALDGEKYVGGSRHALEMLPRRVRIVY